MRLVYSPKNILFTARVYIQQKKWGQLYELPKKLDITSEEAKLTSYYLEIEQKKP